MSRLIRNWYGAYGLDDAAERPADWRDQAACRFGDVDPEVFFPAIANRSSEAESESEERSYVKAKEVCKRCYVQRECAEWAIANDERFGCWGGLTPGQRKAIRNRRAAGA